ncbi:MAG TPA: hypothetical protein DCR17_06155 [Verrucomicrobiales bacterium]|nr:hypothetical protein [Pedosphaera sp.]HAO66250.1 hypothetical protein [Verrucomicrobiales bacterium]HBP55379.1 hypothetical protein [Verrucomicrobiales bacterium]HCP38286.1 hypothetical protein [Verrucomicrobiales bacterium]HCZ02970.1 hypothetical protein [Verrucomicrobiales bacterium]
MSSPAAKPQTACRSNQKTGGDFPSKYLKPKPAWLKAILLISSIPVYKEKAYFEYEVNSSVNEN